MKTFPPRCDEAITGMRADGESRKQQQQQQWRRGWRRRRRRRCRGTRLAEEEPAALPQETTVGHEEDGVFLSRAVPL